MAKLKTFKMTEPQRKLAADNHNLIYSYMHKHGLDDDWYGTLAEALCRAAVNFDESKGHKFATFAYKTMELRHKRELYVQSMQVRKANYEALNIEEEKEGNATLLDTLTANCSVEREVISRVMTDSIFELMSEKEIETCKMRVAGYTQAEIANIHRVTYQAVQNCIRGAKKRFERTGVLETLRA